MSRGGRAAAAKRSTRAGSLCAVAIAVPLLGACGSGGDAGPTPTVDVASQVASDPLHIHGLGVIDDQLFLATHAGMFTVAPGQTRAVGYGVGRQDLEVLTVADDRFLGSGHDPSNEQTLTGLGLIQSVDAGRSWTSASLPGRADLHVLEVSGPRIYGYDGSRRRLLVSRDGGGTWSGHDAPAIISLAIDPAAPDHFVASTAQGLVRSRDAGRSFQPIAAQRHRIGRVAWSGSGLFLVSYDGWVLRSADRGIRFQTVGPLGGQPTAVAAVAGDLYAALADGTVKRSRDRGRTWRIRALSLLSQGSGVAQPIA